VIPPHLHSHKSRNIFLLSLGLLLTYFLYRSPFFPNLISFLVRFGYLGGLLGGFLFSSTFTAGIGLLLLLSLAPHLNLFGLVSAGALGAVLTDIIVFFLVRKKIDEHVSPGLRKLIHSRYFSWTLPLIGAFIIVSPLPNELGVSLFSIAHAPPEEFAFVSLLSHTLTIFLVISAASLLT
jgi:hypothetical protein